MTPAQIQAMFDAKMHQDALDISLGVSSISPEAAGNTSKIIHEEKKNSSRDRDARSRDYSIARAMANDMGLPDIEDQLGLDSESMGLKNDNYDNDGIYDDGSDAEALNNIPNDPPETDYDQLKEQIMNIQKGMDSMVAGLTSIGKSLQKTGKSNVSDAGKKLVGQVDGIESQLQIMHIQLGGMDALLKSVHADLVYLRSGEVTNTTKLDIMCESIVRLEAKIDRLNTFTPSTDCHS